MKLTNRQTELVHGVKSALERHRRGSLEANAAWLEAAAALSEARDAAKRKEWGPFLEACGVEERTARNMVRVHRSDATAETVSAFGGVGAFLSWLSVAEMVEQCIAHKELFASAGYPDVPAILLGPKKGVLGDEGAWDAADRFERMRKVFPSQVAAMDWAIEHGSEACNEVFAGRIGSLASGMHQVMTEFMERIQS